MSKILSFVCLCLLGAGIAQAQQVRDDFSAGLNSKVFDVDSVGRDAAVVHGVLFHDSAEIGLKKGMVQQHELWLQNGPVITTKESFETPIKVRVLWAHESSDDRQDYLAVTVRGDGLKVVGQEAYKQAVLQNGVSLVVHTNGQVQLVEMKNGKPQQLATVKVDAFPRGGRVNWFVIEVTDVGGMIRADISNAYLEGGKHICSIEGKPKGKFNPKGANKVMICNRQLNENERPGNNSWIRDLQIGPMRAALATLK